VTASGTFSGPTTFDHLELWGCAQLMSPMPASHQGEKIIKGTGLHLHPFPAWQKGQVHRPTMAPETHARICTFMQNPQTPSSYAWYHQVPTQAVANLALSGA
jgi:hypothetical protein